MLIVRSKSTDDVMKCVKFVKDYGEGITFCVACGAHSNRCMLSDSIVLDLCEMKKVVLDDDKSLVTVEGGAYLEEVDKVLAPHGLGTTVGTYPQTGVGVSFSMNLCGC